MKSMFHCTVVLLDRCAVRALAQDRRTRSRQHARDDRHAGQLAARETPRRRQRPRQYLIDRGLNYPQVPAEARRRLAGRERPARHHRDRAPRVRAGSESTPRSTDFVAERLRQAPHLPARRRRHLQGPAGQLQHRHRRQRPRRRGRAGVQGADRPGRRVPQRGSSGPKTTKGPKGETVADKSNPWYGGWGYGRHGRPDLSNAQIALEALHDAGLKPDDPAYQAALVFVTRMQNSSRDQRPALGRRRRRLRLHPRQQRRIAWPAKSIAPDGRRMLRSYGSMTYAGLKSMIYAGLTKDDPRVKAAVDWITKNWTLDENPGMRLAGPGDRAARACTTTTTPSPRP